MDTKIADKYLQRFRGLGVKFVCGCTGIAGSVLAGKGLRRVFEFQYSLLEAIGAAAGISLVFFSMYVLLGELAFVENESQGETPHQATDGAPSQDVLESEFLDD